VDSVYVRRRRFRRWLGAQFDLDESGGDRLARRFTHGLGALLLIYYLLPVDVFVVVTTWEILLAALVAGWVLEGTRHIYHFELPMIRPYEEHRIASYVFYATALVAAVLLLPLPIAATVILGTALVDPIAGELRGSSRYRALYPAVPFGVYAMLAFVGLGVIGAWPWIWAIPLGLLAAGLALAAEYPKISWLDDDLTMTFVPALVLLGISVFALGRPV
jgi:hypothetical protein